MTDLTKAKIGDAIELEDSPIKKLMGGRNPVLVSISYELFDEGSGLVTTLKITHENYGEWIEEEEKEE